MAVAIIGAAVQVVSAVPAAVRAVEAAVEFAERSCVIEIDNMTAESFALVSHGHESGAFRRPPPARVEPFDHALMSSHSTAVGQGAVGSIDFAGRDVHLHIDFGNPFIGDNRIDAHVDGPRIGEFQVETAPGGGNTGALLRCVISHPVQDNWRFCGKCHGLFFNGPDVANHHCPAGDLHLPLGLEFVLPHSIPDGPQMQSTWRFCARCHDMFFADSDTQHHRCAGFQGVHDAAGLVFALPHDLPETATVQTNWRFCVNCHGMFFDGPEQANHRCPAGDLHAPAGFMFALPHKPPTP